MKAKLLILNLLFSCFLIAQTAEERDKMLKTYDLQKVNSLIEKIKDRRNRKRTNARRIPSIKSRCRERIF